MLVKVSTATLEGINALPITVEVNATIGVRFTIVGLPDNAVKESHERIMSSLGFLGIRLPARQIVVNLAPANVKKEGSGFDLPVAIGVLAATEVMKSDRLSRFMMVGELGLDGAIQPIKGALPIAIQARKMGLEGLLVPKANVREAAVVNRLNVYGIENIKDVVDFFNAGAPQFPRSDSDELSGIASPDGYPESLIKPTFINTREEFFSQQYNFDYDFEDVRGQENVKRAFEVAAAGGHNIILIGSPGCGKSMMSKRIPSILPPLSLAESLETTQIHSVAGKLDQNRGSALITQRPFRAPHHTISDVALVGGGNTFMPGEICLAHNGVLFLDELPEFSRNVLETLRQPLEDRIITISRARYNLTMPCSFMLVASMNPCPCGYHNHPVRPCTCTPGQIQRYMGKISGPLMDRIDIQVEVESVPFEDIAKAPKGESSASIRERVIRARQIQQERFDREYQERVSASAGGQRPVRIHSNSQMNSAMLKRYVTDCLEDGCLEKIREAMKRLSLSARAYDRILKVSRTIADLEASPTINKQHIAEAISYRNLDRSDWAERGI